MAQTPPTIDAEFKFVAHPFRIRAGDVLWYVFWVGGYAGLAYAVNDRAASVALVFCAGLAWPVRRFLASLKREVSKEQADWIVDRVTGADRRQNQRKRIDFDASNRL